MNEHSSDRRYLGLAAIKEQGAETSFDSAEDAKLSAAERAQRRARETQKRAAYEAGRAGYGGPREVPVEYALADREWFRGHDDAARQKGYYLVEMDGEREPAHWDGREWMLIGDEVPRESVGKIIDRITMHPELDYC